MIDIIVMVAWVAIGLFAGGSFYAYLWKKNSTPSFLEQFIGSLWCGVLGFFGGPLFMIVFFIQTRGKWYGWLMPGFTPRLWNLILKGDDSGYR